MNAGLTVSGLGHGVREGGVIKPTLAPLSHWFAPGALHVVGGPSGVGKTTLLSLLSLTVRATQGCIRWGERELTALSPEAANQWRRAHLGMIFQTSRLIGVMTVAEQITLAATLRRDAGAVARGHALLARLGMEARLAQRPAQLSGGEKQRVALAQALCAQPAVLLADEPTAALDRTNGELVATMLRDFARETAATVICVSHDRTVIDLADTYLLLERP